MTAWRSAGRRLGGRGALVVLCLVACEAPRAAGGDAAAADSTGTRDLPLRDVTVTGAFTARDVRESSGLARSRRQAGVFWTHNDSGDAARLFAVDSGGADLGAVTVTGATNRDWEALALGPCDAGPCLYLGDVGDNLARRAHVTIWRVPEPDVPGAGRTTASAPADSLAFTYPDGPRDVEALWVDADTVTWLVTKRQRLDAAGARRPALVYRLPASAWRANAPATAELVDSLPHVATRDRRTLITDAALSDPLGADDADGLLAVRTYELLYLFRAARRSGRPGALVARCALDPLAEVQGEGITWLPDGRLLLSSEKRGAPLHALRCP